MRLHHWAFAATLVAGLPVAAFAQQPNDQNEKTTTTVTQTTSSTRGDSDSDFDSRGQWFASAFVGSNFGARSDLELDQGSSLDFGGGVGYMWKKALGAEFLAGFTPNFRTNSNVLFGERPQVNSYMFNAIGAIPVGSNGAWQPFLSGGFGALTLRSDVLSGTGNNTIDQTFSPDDTQFGGNIGGGIMGYAGNVGIRADVRYFHGFKSNDAVDANNPVADNILSGLDFWRANIGVAVRW
jgi:Outer membrane protein beta-barrel domain